MGTKFCTENQPLVVKWHSAIWFLRVKLCWHSALRDPWTTTGVRVESVKYPPHPFFLGRGEVFRLTPNPSGHSPWVRTKLWGASPPRPPVGLPLCQRRDSGRGPPCVHIPKTKGRKEKRQPRGWRGSSRHCAYSLRAGSRSTPHCSSLLGPGPRETPQSLQLSERGGHRISSGTKCLQNSRAHRPLWCPHQVWSEPSGRQEKGALSGGGLLPLRIRVILGFPQPRQAGGGPRHSGHSPDQQHRRQPHAEGGPAERSGSPKDQRRSFPSAVPAISGS